jgi:hypothetical protein
MKSRITTLLLWCLTLHSVAMVMAMALEASSSSSHLVPPLPSDEQQRPATAIQIKEHRLRRPKRQPPSLDTDAHRSDISSHAEGGEARGSAAIDANVILLPSAEGGDGGGGAMLASRHLMDQSSSSVTEEDSQDGGRISKHEAISSSSFSAQDPTTNSASDAYTNMDSTDGGGSSVREGGSSVRIVGGTAASPGEYPYFGTTRL